MSPNDYPMSIPHICDEGIVSLVFLMIHPLKLVLKAKKLILLLNTYIKKAALYLPICHVTLLFVPKAVYMFLALAFVCDDYFVASLDKICEVNCLFSLTSWLLYA